MSACVVDEIATNSPISQLKMCCLAGSTVKVSLLRPLCKEGVFKKCKIVIQFFYEELPVNIFT